ncbi:alpha/beta hydrolase [Clostridium sp. D2Q-14]|uniref:alpha/beta fold hydrolase n=1 Tax=Anaeromonas gelatinilytica TaxID=2683194 RepID=UPI00193C1F5D|nr:alpha/beta hydrolase [Anaeromonas gelatinilytica]MBS4534030.1 alpha/beta hydrolase [Anaeromonas gelatinilytica]
MKKEIQVIQGNKNQKLYIRTYRNENTEKNNKEVIQILHGMAEYGYRYEDFANFLVKQGYIVYIHDHRKHGKSVEDGQKIGYYTNDTWGDMVDDVNHVKQLAKKQENVDKIILIGHSMGSFLARNTLMDYGKDISKAVIIGTGYTDKASINVAITMAKILGKTSGKKPSKFLNNLLIGGFNKSFKPNKTSADWLTKDTSIVDSYINDPLCGYSYTPKFYEEILKGLLYIINPENIKKTPNIPLFFIAGEKDPVGKSGTGVQKVNSIYKDLGYNTSIELIPEGRHEILNEINKEDIYKKILKFIKFA